MSVSANMERFAPRYGWANRILCIDLSNRRIMARPVDGYVPDFMGGRGLVARIAWEMCREPIEPFAPENPLIIAAGALTGTRSPYSGRTAIGSFSPQAFPYCWFTRANVGSDWGARLKRAGYDALVITGASEEPVWLVIEDDRVTLRSAEQLWGLDALDTIAATQQELGKAARTMTIGPAGEHLSRIATMQVASSSAAGQGGFGAVMGAKKLKAISVLGSGHVRVAHPEQFAQLISETVKELELNRPTRDCGALNAKLQADKGGNARPYACTASCPTPCNLYLRDMPGVAHPDRLWEGNLTCVGSSFKGLGEGGSVSRGGLFDWKLGLYAGFEMNVLSNRYGLNQWDIIMSMVPWLERCQWDGLLSEMNGVALDWQSPQFWDMFLHALAYREGMGDALAEGGRRAARLLDLGEGFARRYYTAWGFGGHWDGHSGCQNHLVFPYWIVSALQWATDTRDPYSSSHGYVQNVMRHAPFGSSPSALTWDQLRTIGERVYGSAEAVDPHGAYRAKAFPAYYHDRRSVMKDSVPTDDQVFPLIYSVTTEDRFFRVGDIGGPDIDSHLFRLGTATEWEPVDLEQAAERVYTLERALCVRHWGRDREMDLTALAAFEYEENWASPMLGRRYALDREQFLPVLDEYYGYLGWDPDTGWPTPERLAELGLDDVCGPMVSGAERALAERVPWPAEPPVNSANDPIRMRDRSPALPGTSA